MTCVAGRDETQETGTATGELQVVGTTTVAGADTNDETGTATIAVLGIVWITLHGAEFGTSED